MKKISINKKDVVFKQYQTVNIFDEIQECANARLLIKYFCLDGRYDVLANSYLLGIRGYSKKYNTSIPVGFGLFHTMKAMDFEEFLWAIGYEKKLLIHC